MDTIESVRLEYTASVESPNDIWVMVSGAILQGEPDLQAIGEALEPIVQAEFSGATFTNITVSGTETIAVEE